MHLRGCQNCRACKKADLGYCVIQDDLRPYWDDLKDAGALILGAPNYASNVCGPMITYMNRHYCLIGEDLMVRHPLDIKLIAIFSQGLPDPLSLIHILSSSSFEVMKICMLRNAFLIFSAKSASLLPTV